MQRAFLYAKIYPSKPRFRNVILSNNYTPPIIWQQEASCQNLIASCIY